MIIDLTATLQLFAVLNVLLILALHIAVCRWVHWQTYSEQKDITQRIAVDASYKEGQLRTNDRIISMQDDRIEGLRDWNSYLTDLLVLSLEGEDLKPYLNTVREAIKEVEDDE